MRWRRKKMKEEYKEKNVFSHYLWRCKEKCMEVKEGRNCPISSTKPTKEY